MRKGEPVIVTGRLRASKWKDQAGEERSRLVVEAMAIGHDDEGLVGEHVRLLLRN